MKDTAKLEQQHVIVLTALHMWHGMAECTRMNELAAMQVARDMGVSWTEIGKAVNMSRQSAHKRYGPLMEQNGNHLGDDGARRHGR